MNKKIKRLLSSFILACAGVLIMPCSIMTALAGSAKISFSDPNATVGQEFNLSVKVTATEGNLGASDVMLSYDPACVEFISGNNANGGAGSVRLVGTMNSDTTTVFSYNLKFKALQAGNTAISVGSYEVYDADTKTVEVSKVGSSTVKVKATSTSSKEAALSSLKVSPGQIVPAFSSDVMAYTVNVGKDVNKIAVSANAKDGKAKVLVSGDSNLKMGANTVICKVTAEDGQTVKSYKITVNKSESLESQAESPESEPNTQTAVMGELKADINGKEYSIATSFDPAALPEGYTQSSCTYNGTEIACGVGNDITLIYLQGSEGSGAFYIYAPETGALSPYVTIDVSAKSIVVLPIDDSIEVPSGFAQTTIKLNGDQEVKGWVWQSDEEQKYCVVYGMNEAGEKGLYRYDIAEKTFQRYFEDPALKTKYNDAEVEKLLNEYNSLCKDYNIRFIIIVVLIVICLILFFMVVNLLLKRRERSYDKEEALTPVKRRAIQQEEMKKNYQSFDEKREPEPSRRRRSSNPTERRGHSREAERADRGHYNTGTQESLRQKELEREERARLAKERLERERQRDHTHAREPEISKVQKDSYLDDDDFEFIDLD